MIYMLSSLELPRICCISGLIISTGPRCLAYDVRFDLFGLFFGLQKWIFILQITQCDEILLRIQVPDAISRTRTLLDCDKWKGKLHMWLLLLLIVRDVGSQLREWVLYFALPVLTGKLPGEYLKHFSVDRIPTHSPC